MPTYFYTAITAAGERVSGSEVAQDERELGRIISERGYILTTVNTQEQKKGSFLMMRSFLPRRGVSLSNKLLFTRNLQVMVSAGVPLPKCLDVLSAQTSSRAFREVLADVKKKVVEGQSLSAAFQNHPHVFSELFSNMIKVGEESGTVEQVLEQLTLQMERSHELRSKIIGALLYPSVVILTMLGVGALMLVVVIPQLGKVFSDLGVPLPLTTRVVIGTGTFLSRFWYIAFPSFFIFLALLFQLAKRGLGKSLFDAAILRIPLVGGLAQKASCALIARTLSSLIASGVPIVRSLEITSQVVGNVYFRDSLVVCAEKVKKGEKFSGALSAYKNLYPLAFLQMVEVGEETGETAHLLGKLAEFYEGEVGQATKNLTSVIEPILMLIIGATVGFFAVSMIQPIYGMLSALQ